MAPKKKSISENERALGAYQAEAKAIREKDKELSDSEKKRLEFLDKQEKKLKKVLEIQRELFEVQQDCEKRYRTPCVAFLNALREWKFVKLEL